MSVLFTLVVLFGYTCIALHNYTRYTQIYSRYVESTVEKIKVVSFIPVQIIKVKIQPSLFSQTFTTTQQIDNLANKLFAQIIFLFVLIKILYDV